MATAIYTRVSSKSQDAASQLPDLERWVKAQDGEVEWFRDKFTGKTMDRPGWNQLWAGVASGEIKTIVAWRLDRLGRTAIELLQLAKELRARGVRLVLIREGFSVGDDSPAGRLFLTMLSGFAEYELEVRSERQLAGIEAAKARGVVFGRRKGTGKPITVSEEIKAHVRHLAANCKTKRHIARVCKLSPTTVYRILDGNTESM